MPKGYWYAREITRKGQCCARNQQKAVQYTVSKNSSTNQLQKGGLNGSGPDDGKWIVQDKNPTGKMIDRRGKHQRWGAKRGDARGDPLSRERGRFRRGGPRKPHGVKVKDGWVNGVKVEFGKQKKNERGQKQRRSLCYQLWERSSTRIEKFEGLRNIKECTTPV